MVSLAVASAAAPSKVGGISWGSVPDVSVAASSEVTTSSGRSAARGSVSGRGSPITTSDRSTRSAMRRQPSNSPSWSVSNSDSTSGSGPQATNRDHSSAAIVTSAVSNEGARETTWRSPGTTSRIRSQSASIEVAASTASVVPAEKGRSTGASSARNSKDPCSNRKNSNTTSAAEVGGAPSMSPEMIRPSSTHNEPRPRSPSMSSRPVLEDAPNNWSTSAIGNESIVPCSATARSPDGYGELIGSSGARVQFSAANPAAAAMTSTGAASSVMSSNATAAWCTSIPRPPTVRHPAVSAASSNGVRSGS